MRALRGGAPLLPTHGGSFSSGRGSSWKPPKKRGNVFIKLMVATFMIAACAYGGFAWAVLRRTDAARAAAPGRGLHEDPHSGGHSEHYQQHDPHAYEEQQHSYRREHQAEMHQQQQREQQQREAAEHARITRERNARATQAQQQQQHQGGALHEASGDLHHGGHSIHGMQGSHGHETAQHDKVDQRAADLQHQADIKQQEELTNTHAPVTDPPAVHTTTTTHEEFHAPVTTPSHLSTGAHDTHARHLEVEQVLPKHTQDHQPVVTSPPAVVGQHDLRTNEADLHAPVTAPEDTPKHTEHAPVVQHAVPAVQTEHVAPVTDTSIHPQATQLPHASEQQQAQAQHTAPVVTAPVVGRGLYALSAVDADGLSQPLSQYAGKVTLVVNVASHCGYTDENYKGLKALYDKYHIHGLEILAFPCNQFGSQEPGTESEIKEFCSTRYHTSFPIMAKVEVNGPHAHEVFKYLKSSTPTEDVAAGDAAAGDDIGWNFFKFLVDRTGTPIKRWNQRWNQVSMEREVYAALVHKPA